LSQPASQNHAGRLYGKRLGFQWVYHSGRGTGTTYELRVDTAGDSHVMIDQRDVGLTAILVGWPAFEDGRIYWSRGCFGDPGGCTEGVAQLRRGTYEPPLSHQQAAGPRFLLAHERAGAITWVLEQTSPGPDTQWCVSARPGLAGTCVIRPLQPGYATGSKGP
jgi:hypothetical protein